MPIEEQGGYCDHCQRHVLGRRNGINHILHLLISLFTCGLWVIPWFFASMTFKAQFACPNCGGGIRT